ncbi:MAG: gliding motility-associated ABC transporter permease subunit GldF [Bacteroidia bacterium]|jgi:ABC-2 type transport system permease protein|nr:gliding motility-associated ABC transporter permease subunit GldF [Bacteroidia bacterium]
MFALIRKEINGFLNSLIGYIVIFVFLLTIGLFLWVFPDSSFNILEAGYANLDPLFIITPWVYLLLIPAITMRLFSEEKKTGTIELLLTRPLTEMQVVIAKYLAGVILVFISLVPTLIYYFSVSSISLPAGNLDSGAIWGSYIGLLLLGACFVSIGLFSSSLADNQVVAFIISFFLCLFCFKGFESIAGLFGMSKSATIIFDLGINAHYLSLSRGVVDTRDIVYFLSVILFFLFLTRTIIESRKW